MNMYCSVCIMIMQVIGIAELNIFMNDAVYFIQKCDFVNYVDGDTLSKIASTMESLMECLIHDS